MLVGHLAARLSAWLSCIKPRSRMLSTPHAPS